MPNFNNDSAENNNRNGREAYTAMRDIVDVLYDGYCKVLRDEELCNTIEKKLIDLNRCSQRERHFKLLKIMSILADVQKNRNQETQQDALQILEDVYDICLKIMNSLQQAYEDGKREQ